MKKFVVAFTIAEIIIVLGIIGIIAQMTIPDLIANTQESIWENAAKEAFSKSSQAVQQMRMDEGGTLAYYFNNVQTFKPVFIKYFKIIKDCNLRDCVPQSNTSEIYKTWPGKIKANTYLIDDGQFITADGMFFGIENASLNANLLGITVDVNGYTKGPNQFGKDVYMFQILNDSLVPMGGAGTRFPATAYCNKTYTASTDALQGIGCMSNVMQGIEYLH